MLLHTLPRVASRIRKCLVCGTVATLILASAGNVAAQNKGGNNQGGNNNNQGGNNNNQGGDNNNQGYTRTAPEINPGVIVGGAALVVGGVLLLRARRRLA